MKIYIENVEPGAMYNNQIYDYWISAKLSSGLKIKIFDFVPFDLRNFKMKEIEGLIVAGFIEKKDDINIKNVPIVSGRFLGRYSVSEQWNKLESTIRNRKLDYIETIDGLLLINHSGIERWNIQINDSISFSVMRFDLVGANL